MTSSLGLTGGGGGGWVSAPGEDYAFAYDCPSFSDRVLCLTTGTPPVDTPPAPLRRSGSGTSSSSSGLLSPSGSFDDLSEVEGGSSQPRSGSLQAKRRKTMRQSLGGDLDEADVMASADRGATAAVPPSPSRRNPMVRTAKRRHRSTTSSTAGAQDDEESEDGAKTSGNGDEEEAEEQEQQEARADADEITNVGGKKRKSASRNSAARRRSELEDQETCGMQTVMSEPSEVVKIHVSGLLLAAKSSFFRSLFASGMRETHQKEVWLQLNKAEMKPMQDIIRFMYEGKLQANSFSEQLDVLVTADKFDVPSAVDAASRGLAGMEFSLEQCEEILSLISNIQSSPSLACLIARCQEILYDWFGNLDLIWDQKEFWELSPAALRTVLDCDKCEIMCENDVFHILRTWLEKDMDRLPSLAQILPSVRWPMMDCNFLNDIVAQAKWLQSCPVFQSLHKEALVWLSFSKERQELNLANQTQIATNKRYRPRPQPADIRKKLSFTWKANLKDGSKLYTSPYFLFKGYYFYCELSEEGDNIGFFICINQRPYTGDVEEQGDDSMSPCYVHFRALVNVLHAGTGDVAYTRKGTGMFTSLNDGWGWYDFLDTCTWNELRTRDFVSPNGTITFAIKLELKKK